jgi:hypothetical protein
MTRLRKTLAAISMMPVLLFTGCSDANHPPPPPPARDLGEDAARDGGDVDGDVLLDGGMDAEALSDGHIPSMDGEAPLADGAPSTDATLFLDGFLPIDAASLDDAGPVDANVGDAQSAFPDLGPRTCTADPCSCPPVAYPCGAGETCPLGTTCVATGCGTAEYCLRGGAHCIDGSDCPVGSLCTFVAVGQNVCVGPSGSCADSRECPDGFACEGVGAARACVDRRVFCDPTHLCPHGYACRRGDGVTSFCAPVHLRCANPRACEGRQCVDLDGDSVKECAYAGCASHTECTGGQLCSFDPAGPYMACGSFGVCSTTADCGAGFTCIDVWGDGVSQCELEGSTCAAGTCPAGQLCGSLASGGVAQCLTAL